jgi:hypothetical protein
MPGFEYTLYHDERRILDQYGSIRRYLPSRTSKPDPKSGLSSGVCPRAIWRLPEDLGQDAGVGDRAVRGQG